VLNRVFKYGSDDPRDLDGSQTLGELVAQPAVL